MDVLLTIAIPTYNRKNFLKRSLESILRQYDERIEIVVSDNASDDGTEAMITEHFPQVRYYRNPRNIGVDKNFLRCYELAQGKFIWLLGSDDVVVENSILTVLNFLDEHEELSLVFLNETSFWGEYIDADHCEDPFLTTDKKTAIIHSRTEFMRYVRHQLTFMSDFLIAKTAYGLVTDPKKYCGCNFIHTAIALEATKSPDTIFGVIFSVCVAQDLTPKNSPLTENPKIFEIFGQWEKYVLCEVGSQNGYNLAQMKKIHEEYLCGFWGRTILSFKAKDVPCWRKHFWEYGFPAIREYPKAWFTIMPALLVPDFIAKFGRIYIKPLFAGHKEAKVKHE